MVGAEIRIGARPQSRAVSYTFSTFATGTTVLYVMDRIENDATSWTKYFGEQQPADGRPCDWTLGSPRRAACTGTCRSGNARRRAKLVIDLRFIARRGHDHSAGSRHPRSRGRYVKPANCSSSTPAPADNRHLPNSSDPRGHTHLVGAGIFRIGEPALRRNRSSGQECHWGLNGRIGKYSPRLSLH
jgi:hypothetical protein